MRIMPLLACSAAAGLAAMGTGCSANSNDPSLFNGNSSGAGGSAGAGGSYVNPGTGGSGGLLGDDDSGVGDDCSDNAKKIFVVSAEEGLYTFDPTVGGLAAYQMLGTLNCDPTSSPQTMGVDRSGTAWVFYSAGRLYRVATGQGGLSCTPTSYTHPGAMPGGMYTLGMGFTAAAPQTKDQVFYMLSESFGLASIDYANTFAVSMTNALQGISGELTGGPDARLFTYEADNGRLSEVLVGSGYAMQTITTLNSIAGASAWAFSRYGGVFYVFTSDGFSTSQCSMYDESNGAFNVRDYDVGFTVVGAGQSTCVPPPVPK